MPMREDQREVEDAGSARQEVPIKTPSDRVQSEKSKDAQAENVSPLVKTYKPHVPHP